MTPINRRSNSVLHLFVPPDSPVIEVHVHERRKYHSATYTWLYAEANGMMIEGPFGDPFPCVMPSRSACLFELRMHGFDLPVEPRAVLWLNMAWRKCLFIICSAADIEQHVTQASRDIHNAKLHAFHQRSVSSETTLETSQ